MSKFNIGDTVRVPINVGDFATVLAVTDRLVTVEMDDETKMVRCFLQGELCPAEGPRFHVHQLVRVKDPDSPHYLKEGIVDIIRRRNYRLRLPDNNRFFYHESQLEETDALSRARRFITPGHDAEAKRRDLAKLAGTMTEGTDRVRTAYLTLCAEAGVDTQDWPFS